MATIDERLAALETELRAVRDRLDIYQLTAAYGPLVDAGEAKAVSELWTVDGEYDWGRGKAAAPTQGMVQGSYGGASSRAEIAEMVKGSHHQDIINGGSAHVLSLPHVLVQGDTAVSTCYSCLFRHDGGGFRAYRVTASHFHWVREADGWKVKRRLNRLLDGSAEARTLLATGMAGKLPD